MNLKTRVGTQYSSILQRDDNSLIRKPEVSQKLRVWTQDGLSDRVSPARRSNCFGLLKRRLIMGKGDKKSKRGKIFSGSYGNTRPHKKKKEKEKEKEEGKK